MLAKSEFQGNVRCLDLFFPMPKIFFPSAIIWIILSTIIWFWIGADIAKIVGFNIDEDAEPIIGLGYFISHKFIWFYLYYLIATIIFASFGLDILLTNGKIGPYWDHH